jgi:hypothetical protein
MVKKFTCEITTFFDDEEDEESIDIEFLVNKKDWNVIIPSDVVIQSFHPFVYKYVPEYVRIKLDYDEKSIKDSCSNPDDCVYIVYTVYIYDDENIEIKPLSAILNTDINKIPQQKLQIIHDIVQKIVNMFLDFDPNRDTEQTIRKKVWDIFNNIRDK